MLQRAASNAYSWWWASHIRTKQSKWLEQNLQDMGEKVENVLNLIQEDGDSFAKRAEMYYRKRPELINFVEESYRAYRALAERYEHISTELQNANNTIATVFPERVHFAMDEDDERKSQKTDKNPQAQKPDIPKVPNFPNRDLRGLLTTATKKMQAKKRVKTAFMDRFVVKSGLSKDEAVEEIDKLQKGILSLQTEKEFVKSSYDNQLSRYWEIEKHIAEKHDKICRLQDEFSVERVIEDDEARKLMATSALKSCHETLISLQRKHKKYAEESKIEYEKIEIARKKSHSVKNELFPNPNQDEPTSKHNTSEFLNQEQDNVVTHEKNDLESLREKIKDYFEDSSNNADVTVNEMVEKIDELVNMVINFETASLSQSALIRRLQAETGELQAHINSLENNHMAENLINGKLRELEEKLHKIEDMKRNVEDQNNNIQTGFTQARYSLDQLTEKLRSVMKPNEAELESAALPIKDDGSLPPEIKLHCEFNENINPPDTLDTFLEISEDPKLQDAIEKQV